jgi:hypothetical protein
MDLRFNGELPGTTWQKQSLEHRVSVKGTITSVNKLKKLEFIRNGIVNACDAEAEQTRDGAWRYTLDFHVVATDSGWIAVRCFEDLPNGKVSFAHTNPVFIDVADQPLIPRRRDAEFFVRRMDEEIARNSGVLSEEDLAEYRHAKKIYQAVLERAAD